MNTGDLRPGQVWVPAGTSRASYSSIKIIDINTTKDYVEYEAVLQATGFLDGAIEICGCSLVNMAHLLNFGKCELAPIDPQGWIDLL